MDDIIIKKTRRKGRGIFANRNFKKGEKIIDIKGKMLNYKQLKKLGRYALVHYLAINENIFIGPSHDLDDYINHSCNPNAGIKIKGRKAFLISIKNIKNGEEITCDYSTIIENNWKMSCMCGEKNCRKIIRNFEHLPRKTQKKYIKLGIVSDFIVKKFSEKSSKR